MKRQAQTESSRARSSAALKAYWADPAVRAAYGAKTREKMANAEVRQRISDRTKEAYARPEVQLSELKRIWAKCPQSVKRKFASFVLGEFIEV